MDGHTHPHDHDHPHDHPHEDCTEVLVQLAAVISALNSTGRVILKDHIAHCIVDAVESGDREAVDSLNQAIDRFMR